MNTAAHTTPVLEKSRDEEVPGTSPAHRPYPDSGYYTNTTTYEVSETPQPTKQTVVSNKTPQTENTEENNFTKHTRAAKLRLGVRIPSNTLHANHTALRAFCRFVTAMPGFIDRYFRAEPHLKSYYLDDKERRETWQQTETRKSVFSDNFSGHLPHGYHDWTDDHLKKIRCFLIEFVVNYKTLKNESEFKPSTMKGYILGLQISFGIQWGYKLKLLEGNIFNCPDEGLMSVIDNRFSLQQAQGMFTESNNVLSHDDLVRLYNSASLSRNSPSGFQARLIFEIALITAMRPTALVTLTLDQFSKIKLRWEEVWKIRSTVGSHIGASKTNLVGWNAVREKPTEMIVWNRSCLDGNLNIFQDIDDYMHMRKYIECESARFFLGCNLRGKKFDEFFRRQHVGKNSFSRIVKKIFEEENISGSGVKEGMTTHGIRGSVTTMLLEAGQADSTVAMRTGHRDLRSLKNYQNLHGKVGMIQQDAIFNGKGEGVSREEEVGNNLSSKRKRQIGDERAGGLRKRKVMRDVDRNHCEESLLKDGELEAVDKEKKSVVGKENPEICEQLEGEGRDNAGMQLLSAVKKISGGSFNISVHNHYR